MNTQSAISAALASCENEPIHAPGAIQPHGVLLVLEPNALTVRHVSGNWHEMMGGEPGVRPGHRMGDLLGPAAETALRDFLAEGVLDEPRSIPVHPAGAGDWHALAHCKGDLVFLELEPAVKETASPLAVLAAVREAVARLSAGTTTSDLCSAAAQEIRRLTGYDRVMVYQFDREWNGRVVAEQKRLDHEPYLGLHYPASDIPAQARALYLVNRLRVIPDAVYRPVPVIPDADGRTGRPLDLSRCLLRSVSPVHLEYLKNMGVRATLTASLIVSGKLWGLIACHHLTPRRLGAADREACDLLAQVASAHLASRTESEDQAYRVTLTGGPLGRWCGEPDTGCRLVGRHRPRHFPAWWTGPGTWSSPRVSSPTGWPASTLRRRRSRMWRVVCWRWRCRGMRKSMSCGSAPRSCRQ